MEAARFERVSARRPDLRFPLPADFSSRLEGQTVRSLGRRAKYLVATLTSGEILLMHLGMSGSFRIERPGGASPDPVPIAFDKHDHVVFEMSSRAVVIFNDPRRFGFMKLIPAVEADQDVTLGALGPEPLDRAFSALVLAQAVGGKKTSLKVTLLDQRVVAGLGNIYVCEALHRARLSPKRRASTIASRAGEPTAAALALAAAIRIVLTEAIARGSRREYRGQPFRVYDREGGRCLRRGCTGVIKRIVQAGRSTFFCPVCQR